MKIKLFEEFINEEVREVKKLRSEERAELAKAIPNIETFVVNGKIDKSRMNDEESSKYDEIYDKYDKLITPLLSCSMSVEKQQQTSLQEQSKLKGYDVHFYHVRNDEIESEFVEASNEKEAVQLATIKHRMTYPGIRFQFHKIITT